MRRNSSSTLYSRSESNSVPPPRPCAERSPTSRMRALLMRSSASSRDLNGGEKRRVPGGSRGGGRGGRGGCAWAPQGGLGRGEAAAAAGADRGRRRRPAVGGDAQPRPPGGGPQRRRQLVGPPPRHPPAGAG